MREITFNKANVCPKGGKHEFVNFAVDPMEKDIRCKKCNKSKEYARVTKIDSE